MKNKEIQEERMRGYFIQAARDLIRSEGLKSISVRYVAEQAGYSYATLYNYFKDIKDLVAECILEFQQECRKFVADNTAAADPGLPRIKAITGAYIKYHIQYPGIFELFYLEGAQGFAHKKTSLQSVIGLLPDLCREEWDYCIDNSLLGRDEIAGRKEQLNFMVTGMLLFYLNRQQPTTYQEFLATVDLQLNRLLGENK